MFLTRPDDEMVTKARRTGPRRIGRTTRMNATDIFIDDWDAPAQFRLDEAELPSGGLLLEAAGELDIATVPELRERLDAAVDAGVSRVVLDLTGVSFMDSVAMAAILHARRGLADRGSLAVVIPSGSYTRLVVEIAGLPRCLDLFETREQALA
jgi:anti-sigma B factor antagonist